MKRKRKRIFKRSSEQDMGGGEAGVQVSESTEAGHPLGHFLDGIPGEPFLAVVGVGTWLPHAKKSDQAMVL